VFEIDKYTAPRRGVVVAVVRRHAFDAALMDDEQRRANSRASFTISPTQRLIKIYTYQQ
jgi:hypothetical protein